MEVWMLTKGVFNDFEKRELSILGIERAIDLARHEIRLFDRLLREVKLDLERYETELESLKASQSNTTT